MRKVIVLGGSTGGIQALSALLDALPEDLSAALFAVIHIPQGKSCLAEVFQPHSRFKVVQNIRSRLFRVASTSGCPIAI